MSTSARSKDQSNDTSDSGSSSISPTSGYSSYDLLDQVSQNSDQDLDKRKSGIFLSVRDSRQNKWKAERRASNDSRSQSVPMISRDAQDYTTGIKPASHRLENPRSSWCVKSSESTPMHSARERKTFSRAKNEKRSTICERKGSPQKVQNYSGLRYFLIYFSLSFPEFTRMHDYLSSTLSFRNKSV